MIAGFLYQLAVGWLTGISVGIAVVVLFLAVNKEVQTINNPILVLEKNELSTSSFPQHSMHIFLRTKIRFVV